MKNRFLIASSGEQYNMVSSWQDEIYLTLLANKKFSLLVRKNGFSDGSAWIYSIRNFSLPSEFIKAYFSIDVIELDLWDFIDDVVPAIRELHPRLGILLELEYENEFIETDDPLITLVNDLIFVGIWDAETENKHLELEINSIADYLTNFIEQHKHIPRNVLKIGEINFSLPNQSKVFENRLKSILDVKSVREHLNNAVWKDSSSFLNSGWGRRDKMKKIERFLHAYLDAHQKLPLGFFEVDGISVEFRDK